MFVRLSMNSDLTAPSGRMRRAVLLLYILVDCLECVDDGKEEKNASIYHQEDL